MTDLHGQSHQCICEKAGKKSIISIYHPAQNERHTLSSQHLRALKMMLVPVLNCNVRIFFLRLCAIFIDEES